MARAALRYAKAIIATANQQGVSANIYQDMLCINKTITDNSELQELLKNPVIKSSVKQKVIKQIFVDTHKITQSAIDLLVNNNRINQLAAVTQKYRILFEQQEGQQNAIITTAVPLGKDLEDKIFAKINVKTGQKLSITNKVDKSIIGGFILRMGDQQYNASIADKLNNLKRELINN